MGQRGQGRGKKSQARPPVVLPPSGKIIPDIAGRKKPAGSFVDLPKQEKAEEDKAQAAPEEVVSTELTTGASEFDDQQVVEPVRCNLEPAPLPRTKSNATQAFEVELDSQKEAGSVGLPESIAKELGFRNVSWSQVTGSYRRERSIEGLLIGSAVGDALGLARSGLSPRAGASMFGRAPLKYQLIPGLGIVGYKTHRILMTMQAMLRSRSQIDHFRNNFSWRLRWYLLSLPITASRATIIAALRLWMGVPSELSGVSSSDNDPLVSALALATVLQGTGHSVERWVTAATKVTHATPEVTEAAILVAHAAHMALMVPRKSFEPSEVMDNLIELTEETSLNSLLAMLREPLAKGWSVRRAGRALGFRKGTPAHAGPTAVLAVYAWLRHPNRFRNAVTSAVRAGGESNTVATLVGGFSGIHLAVDAIPPEWVNQLSLWPQNRKWIDRMTAKLTDWPHGSEDLHAARAMPSYPVRQLFRPVILILGTVFARSVRLPWQIATWLDLK